MTPLGEYAARMSEFIDGGYPAHLDAETVDWRRVSKVSMEAAEAMEALAGSFGENFRKGITHRRSDVMDELLDTAFAALCAVEHLIASDEQAVYTGRGSSLEMLEVKARAVLRRAGLEVGIETRVIEQ